MQHYILGSYLMKQAVMVWAVRIRPEVAATRVVLASPSSSMLPSFPNSKRFNLMLFKKLDKGYASMRYN